MVAKRSADAMCVTDRLAMEDPSMTCMRSTLARINALGLVTTNSQMGKKERYPHYDNPEAWQRAYVEGFMLAREADALCNRLDLEDGLFVATFPYNKEDGYAHDGVPVTRELKENGTFRVFTSVPMQAPPFECLWINTLPELALGDDHDLMNTCERLTKYVVVVDMVWARGTYMFDKLVDSLQGRGREAPKLGTLESRNDA